MLHRLLQSGIVVLYASYLVWSAVSNEPDSECSSTPSDQSDAFTTSKLLGTLFTFLSICYSSVRTGSNAGHALNPSELKEPLLETELHEYSAADDDDAETGRQKVYDDEKGGVSYSYSFFHFIFVLAALYISMLITDFATVSQGEDTSKLDLGRGWPSVWVKVVSSWLALLLYGWTLVAPILLPDRSFD
eukprot:Colp12_sorted_trinity150504_noHs@1727